jgi:hypothetical protein
VYCLDGFASICVILLAYKLLALVKGLVVRHWLVIFIQSAYPAKIVFRSSEIKWVESKSYINLSARSVLDHVYRP